MDLCKCKSLMGVGSVGVGLGFFGGENIWEHARGLTGGNPVNFTI